MTGENTGKDQEIPTNEPKRNKNRMFWNQLREYQTYEVQRTPYIEYINQFISNLQEQKKKNQQLLYF